MCECVHWAASHLKRDWIENRLDEVDAETNEWTEWRPKWQEEKKMFIYVEVHIITGLWLHILIFSVRFVLRIDVHSKMQNAARRSECNAIPFHSVWNTMRFVCAKCTYYYYHYSSTLDSGNSTQQYLVTMSQPRPTTTARCSERRLWWNSLSTSEFPATSLREKHFRYPPPCRLARPTVF